MSANPAAIASTKLPPKSLVQSSALTNRLLNFLVNRILAFKPFSNWAKSRARNMMIERAESMGVPWRKIVAELRSQNLDADLAKVERLEVKYPDYYTTSFHAYEEGNLGWKPATEVEVAAYAVHSRIYPDFGKEGDAKFRQSYHQVLLEQLDSQPQTILDIGCSVGMSSFALQDAFPQAQISGLDLSPYFLAIALRNSQQNPKRGQINWIHAPAENTRLPNACFDLVSLSLVCHELPQAATLEILREARRILRPQGYLAIMDMNPQSEIYAKMPPYILTLLKSTEPYLDEYFSLDIGEAIAANGFTAPTITCNTPRHRVILAKKL